MFSVPNPPPRVYSEWLFSPGSNVHIVKDAAWIAGRMTPFTSSVSHGNLEQSTYPVQGICEVELPVLVPAPGGDGFDCRKLILQWVLYVPSAPNNVIGGGAVQHLKLEALSLDGRPTTSLQDLAGRVTAMFHPTWPLGGPLILWLSPFPNGPQVTTSYQLVQTTYYWPLPKRQEWGRLIMAFVNRNREGRRGVLTQRQLEWVSVNFGSEAEFLRVHNLDIRMMEHRRIGQGYMTLHMESQERQR
ncbi:hypothetical protein HJFPF1_02081 [Paramyrothecium foliicola]|nr:hypothetical protein HJFPF1_02081 [Paramyrothecium foliicola]